MRYYLAFDQGCFRDASERYVTVPIQNISANLGQNNNLKAICEFTEKFDSAIELKQELIKRFPKLSTLRYYDLDIIWRRSYKGEVFTKTNSVPYKKDIYYFNFENLVKVISQNAYEPLFKCLFNRYRFDEYLNKQLFDLYDAILDCEPYYVIEDVARAFLRRALYKDNKLVFKELYTMAMFISNVLELLKPRKSVMDVIQESHNIKPEINLSGTEEFEQIGLEGFTRYRKKK